MDSDIEELFQACLRVREEFRQFNQQAEEELYAAEARMEKDFIVIANHLCAMAKVMLKREGNVFFGGAYYSEQDIRTSAMDLITPLFMNRRNDRIFEVVHVIIRFFNKNREPEPVNVFFYLRGTVALLLSNYNRKTKKFTDPDYIKTGQNVDAYIRKSTRFTRNGNYIEELSAARTSTGSDIAQKNDLLSLCGRVEPIPDNVPAAVDKVFDVLADSGKFQERVNREVLIATVYSITRKHESEHVPGSSYPLELYVERALIEMVYEAVQNLEESFRWRGRFSEMEKKAMFSALEDYLIDRMLGGTDSLYQYLKPHIEGLTNKEFIDKYKGSFQNLTGRAYKILIDKVSPNNS